MKRIVFIFILLLASATTQVSVANNDNNATVTVEGRVLDEAGQPLAGVAIYVKGSGETIYSDFDGNFVVKTKINKKVNLKLSTISYQETEVKIDPSQSKTKAGLNIQLKKNSIF